MTASQQQVLAFMVPGALRQATGGYRYDARLVDGLRERGWRVDVHELDGGFPEGDDQARRAFTEALASLPDGASVVIDGLALGNLGEVAQAHTERLEITALVHHPLGDEEGLTEVTRRQWLAREADILNCVRRVVVTSPFTARRLAELGVHDSPITVIEPGVQPAALAPSAWPAEAAAAPRLLCVATLTPRKGHLPLLDALATLRHHDWQLECVGDGERDPAHAEVIRARIVEHGLEQRVTLRGSLDETALDEVYQRADVVLVPSFYEGYGMVVTEALARGLPLVSTTGGALQDTVPAEASWRVAPGDSVALAAALEQWWSSPDREARRRAAVARREALTGWEGTVDRLVEVLAGSIDRPGAQHE